MVATATATAVALAVAIVGRTYKRWEAVAVGSGL